jgi:tetratricopeptide (TPR) repeat protein
LTLHKAEKLHDPGAELLDQAAGMWARYGRIVLIVAGVVVAAAVLVFFTLRSRDQAEAAAAGRLAEANVLYWQGDYQRSLEQARQVAQQYGSTPSGVDAHRLAGDNAYWKGDYKLAIEEYQAYLSRQKTGLLADAVRRSLAYAFESAGRHQEAAQAFAGLVGVFDRETSAEFLSAAARCETAAGRPAEALKHLQRIVDEYGETAGANVARIQIAELSGAKP